MMNVSLLLWRGELRAQRLVSRRMGITMLQLVVVVGILALLATRVHSLLATGATGATGALPVTNIAVLGMAVTMIIFANIGVVGQESSASVSDIRGWARSLPVSASQVRQLLVATGLFRSALFTFTLIGAAAVGALSASTSWTARAEIACAAMLLPALPVAAGLWFGARREALASPGLVTAPLGIAMMAIAVPFPVLQGPAGEVVRALATPGLTLLGSAQPMEAATMLLLSIIGALWLVIRLGRETETTTILDNPPRAARLARLGERGVVVDLVLHRIRARDLGEIVLLSVLMGVTALAPLVFGATGSSPAGSFLVVLLATSVASVGYGQVRTATRLPAAAESWVRSMPLPSGSLPWVRHLSATLGAWLAVLVFAVILAAGALAGLGIPHGAATVVAVVLTPWSLGAWIGQCRRYVGIRRVLALAWLGQLSAMRAGVVVVLALVGYSIPVALVLLTVDLSLGLAGQLIFRHNTREFA
jgi:hypothetical protein